MLAVVEAAGGVGDPCDLDEVVANPALGGDGCGVDAAGQPVAESCLANVGAGWQVNLRGAGLDLLPLLESKPDWFHEGKRGWRKFTADLLDLARVGLAEP